MDIMTWTISTDDEHTVIGKCFWPNNFIYRTTEIGTFSTLEAAEKAKKEWKKLVRTRRGKHSPHHGLARMHPRPGAHTIRILRRKRREKGQRIFTGGMSRRWMEPAWCQHQNNIHHCLEKTARVRKSRPMSAYFKALKAIGA